MISENLLLLFQNNNMNIINIHLGCTNIVSFSFKEYGLMCVSLDFIRVNMCCEATDTCYE